ncbi:MAG TPA: FkbM family methyltransferase [Candidatus Kapabacteria bacterium]|nr:FkbM family methyltransferase [Candidatus Kapabacteria bacterium]
MEIPGMELERWGSEADGGYIIPTRLMEHISSLISGGVGDNVEFEADVARRLPSVRITMFDHTVPSLPIHAPRSAMWFQHGLGDQPGFLTLVDAVQRSDAGSSDWVAIKLDIEGAEWTVLDSTPEDFWKRVSVLIIEFHHLNDKQAWNYYSTVLSKLDAHLIPIHVHGNNHDSTVHFTREGVHVPHTLEVTYINRSLIPRNSIPRIWNHPGPTSLDRPNKMGIPDLHLDYWVPRKFVFLRRLKKNIGKMFWMR